MRNVEFINAGAGSGKTHKLVNLFADYLSEKGGKNQPGQVILTTFTDLAAAEFLEKARETLLRRNLHDAASQLETAAIGTVHSVAFSFVRRYWYLLGRGANDNVMSESDRNFFINQSLAGIASEEDILFFRELMNEFVFSKFDDNLTKENDEFWKEDLKDVLDKSDQFEIDNLQESIKRSKDFIDKIFNDETTLNENKARNVLKRYLEICGDKKRKENVEKLLKSKPLNYESLFSIAVLKPVKCEITQINELSSVISTAQRVVRSKKYGTMLKEYVERIFALALKWQQEFSDYKAKNRLIDYNDMEMLFLELLNKAEVVEEIKGRYKHVFVDEFQDSSPIQVKIFDRLSELVEKSTWVGDPKQAIYAFRGSDAVLIKAITDLFESGDEKRCLRSGEALQTSYRSRKKLVELTNDVFSRSFCDMRPEKVKLAIDRNDMAEFKEVDEAELRHWHFISGNRASNSDHYRNLAQQVVTMIKSGIQVYDKSIKSLRAIRPEDLVILCRTNKTVSKISDFIEGYGLKTTGRNTDKSFLETAEAKLFISILNFILNPRDDLAKAEILYLCDMQDNSLPGIIKSRVNFIHDRNKVLERMNQNNDSESVQIPQWKSDDTLIRKIMSIRNRVKTLPLPDLIDGIIILLDMKTLVSRWGDAERRINNLELMRKHTLDYDQRCLQLGLGASLNNFIVYLNALGSIEKKAEKVKGAVNVLTYHKAKGLEWNSVILESLDFNELDQNDLIRKTIFGVSDMISRPPSADNLNPGRYILLLPWFAGPKKYLTPDIIELIAGSKEYAETAERIREEIKRLMYVGATRARDYLITTSYHKAGLKWLQNIGCREVIPHECQSEEIDIWNVNHKSRFFSFSVDENFQGMETVWNERSLIKPPDTGLFDTRYLNPSKVKKDTRVTVLKRKSFNHRIAISSDKNRRGESPSDAQIGTCLHNIFCTYRSDSEDKLMEAKAILNNMLMEHVFPEPERIIESIGNLYKFIKETYGSPVRIYRELPLQKYMDNGQIVRGSCDLAWESEKGIIIVDYKSFQGKEEQITDPADVHYAGIYAPQLETYREIIESAGKKVIATLIYYAVSGIVIEIGNR